MILEEGKTYTGKQLAEWFDIKPESYKANKDRKLEELKIFADYELVGNKTKKVHIKTVYNPVYSKQGSESYQLTKSKVDEFWDESGLDTCSRVSKEIYKSEKNWKVQESTIYGYTLKSRDELYGKPWGEGGTLGHCIYQWSKKGEDGKLIPFTEEENKKKKELITKYFGDVTEKTLLVAAYVKAEKLDKEKGFDMLMEWTGMDNDEKFKMFLMELQEVVGTDVLKGTMVYRDNQQIGIKDEGFEWGE